MFLRDVYRHSDKVALVGWARNHRHLAPFNDPSFDLWGLNEATAHDWWKGGQTGWFQMHPKWDFMRKNNRNDPNHWSWLQQEHDFPIYMQHKYPDVPSSERYPLEEVMDITGQYLTSSFSYMLGLAILFGYKEIHLFGFEMSDDSEYRYQKPAAEYLIGLAMGRGIRVVLPENCSLLRGNLYGYEDLRAADRTFLAFQERHAEQVMEQRKNEMHQQKGRTALLQDLLTTPEVMENMKQDGRVRLAQMFADEQAKIVESAQSAAHAEGYLDSVKAYAHWHDTQNIPNDRSSEVTNE